MKKIYMLAAVLSLEMLTACGGNTKEDSANNKYDTTVTKVETEPIADNEQTSKIEVDLGGHYYEISIRRFPDKSLPLVIDELDQKFYDNCVELVIIRDGTSFIKKQVTKVDFKELLPENEYNGGILLGMNCDTARSTSANLCFTAQIGQAGEGPAFLLMVPTGGGEVVVSRDNQQEEIGYDN